MSERNHAPISLAAGSYDVEDLEKVADDASKAKPEERDALVAKGLADANKTPRTEKGDAILPGHKIVETERVVAAGTEQQKAGAKKGTMETVGEVTVTEQVHVFDEKKAGEEKEAAEEAAAGTESTSGAIVAPAVQGETTR